MTSFNANNFPVIWWIKCLFSELQNGKWDMPKKSYWSVDLLEGNS
jgi:hypothetical protein